MQQEFYVSCIKINGISILPPLMTDAIKQEMNYYKRLAIKTEKKLEAKKLIKCTNEYKDITVITEPINESKNNKYISDNEVSNNDSTSTNNNNSYNSYSRITTVESKPMISTETKTECNIQSPTVNTQYSQQVVLTSGINNSECITTHIDEYKHANEAILIIPNESVILSESRKPEVPKTLDIVPITLEDPKCEEANTCPPAIISNENENQPKLSRQGSYVLDAPSPMLLAHMHTELIDNNYVPTPTINVSQRKQWNIMQSKVEWENNQFIVEDSAINKSNKSEHTDSDVVIDSKYESGAAISHIEPDTSIKPYQTNTSISCTQAVVTKEYTCKSDITSSKHINISNTHLERESLLDNSKNDNNICPLNFINKLQEFTINVSNPEIQLFHKNKNKHYDKIEYIKRHEDLTAKSSIISEKLLTVYDKIEEMHKKQMTELISRQQKEQSLLEEEFQKQRLLLLAEIQKCSFRIPYQINVSNVVSNQRNDEARLEDTFTNTNQQWNINSPNSLHSMVHCNSKLPSTDRANIIVGSLDYVSSGNLSFLEHHKASPFIVTDISPRALDLDFTRKINICDAICNYNNDNNNNNDNNSNYKSLNSDNKTTIVNRKLFPLDSKITHVPILDASVYLDKHIHAVNIINAYVRGYLVRRLMRTEHVITLKKIYKEALQCMLKLHVDAPLNLSEVNFLHRLQLQCDAASMNIVDLFAQYPARKMKIIEKDREIKRFRMERPSSARSYSFATQQTLARKNIKEFESTMTKYQRPLVVKKDIIRSRCQTWTSDIREKLTSPNTLHITGQGIRRSTSAGTVRKPWR